MPSAIPVMPGSEVFRRIGGDGFLANVLTQIENISMAVSESGQKGKLVITIEMFKPKDVGLDDPMVAYKTKRVPTYPSPKPNVTHLYVSDEGMHTQDPRQQPMNLHAVEAVASEVRTPEAVDAVVREA